MVLQDFLHLLSQELGLARPTISERKTFLFPIGDAAIEFTDLKPGVSMQAPICPPPEKKREELFTYLMRANLFGQGAGGARIGLSYDEKSLTLSLGLPYEINYQAFKEKLEDFINYSFFWREEVTKFMKQTTLL